MRLMFPLDFPPYKGNDLGTQYIRKVVLVAIVGFNSHIVKEVFMGIQYSKYTRHSIVIGDTFQIARSLSFR